MYIHIKAILEKEPVFEICNVYESKPWLIAGFVKFSRGLKLGKFLDRICNNLLINSTSQSYFRTVENGGFLDC